MWYVRPAKPQISLCIGAVWSEPLLFAWVFYECLATDWTPFGVSNLKRRLHRLVWVYTCQNVKLLEISCRGPKCLLYGSFEHPTHMFKLMAYKKITFLRFKKKERSGRVLHSRSRGRCKLQLHRRQCMHGSRGGRDRGSRPHWKITSYMGLYRI